MADKDYVVRLENVIKQMLTPLKDIPFNLVIESMSGKKVISFDFKNPEHKELLSLLKQTALQAGKAINKAGILRPRPLMSNMSLILITKECIQENQEQ